MSLSPTDTRTPERPRHETVDFFRARPGALSCLKRGRPPESNGAFTNASNYLALRHLKV